MIFYFRPKATGIFITYDLILGPKATGTYDFLFQAEAYRNFHYL